MTCSVGEEKRKVTYYWTEKEKETEAKKRDERKKKKKKKKKNGRLDIFFCKFNCVDTCFFHFQSQLGKTRTYFYYLLQREGRRHSREGGRCDLGSEGRERERERAVLAGATLPKNF